MLANAHAQHKTHNHAQYNKVNGEVEEGILE